MKFGVNFNYGDVMGEAKRRKPEISLIKAAENNLLSMEGQDRIIAITAMSVFNKIVIGLDMVNGCYNLAFFLSEYLQREHQIKVDKVFGWLTNDKCLPVGMAHAWIAHSGRVTDLSVFNNEYPDIMLPGPVLIHGIAYREGNVKYTYHSEIPTEIRLARESMASLSEAHAEILGRREQEYLMLKAMSERPNGGREYFSGDDLARTYEYLKLVLEKT